MDANGPPSDFGPNHNDPFKLVSAAHMDPLDSDPDKKSDHRIVIVIAKPINIFEHKCSRQTRTVTVRPFPQSGMVKFQEWLIDQDWKEVYKASIFQNILVSKLDEIFPEKKGKVQSDDQPLGCVRLTKCVPIFTASF